MDRISLVFRTIWKYYILNICKPIRKITLFSPSFAINLSPKTRLKCCILGLNFVSDLTQVGEKYSASRNILVVNDNPLDNFL